jgi:tetratricopeptide (TPR) repeat protein
VYRLASLYQAKGEYDHALAPHEEALEVRRRALPPGHPDTAQLLNSLASLAKGEYDRALPVHEEALWYRGARAVTDRDWRADVGCAGGGGAGFGRHFKACG